VIIASMSSTSCSVPVKEIKLAQKLCEEAYLNLYECQEMMKYVRWGRYWELMKDVACRHQCP
jgi:hypothetical protein